MNTSSKDNTLDGDGSLRATAEQQLGQIQVVQQLDARPISDLMDLLAQSGAPLSFREPPRCSLTVH
jgi:hypothetical protein